MALRKQPVRDGVISECQTDESPQQDDAVDDKDELSFSLLPPAALSRDTRRRERENKSKCKEMTEEEMMDLALRLSEQEASVTASRLKQEEEAMTKAIKESMVSQTQTSLPSQSQSLLADDPADVSLQLCSRRKLLPSNGKMISASHHGDSCPTGAGETKTTGINRNKKRKRKEGFLPESPDLLQTQDVFSRASPCSSESVSVLLDSPQSSDSTQIDDCQLRKSPVFPLTGCRATLCISRLSQELLETCKSSGFVSYTQDIWTQKSPIVEAKSPTFPKSPVNFSACANSPVFTDTDQGNDGEQEMSPERGESPVFGRTTQHEQPQSACKPQACKNSGFMFSSQESLSSTGRFVSCRPKSPVFPGSGSISNSLPETSAISKSPVFSGTERGQAGQGHGCSTEAGQRQTVDPDAMNSAALPSSAEPRGSNCEMDSATVMAHSQSLEEDGKTDHSQAGGFTKLSQSTTGDAQVNEAYRACISAEAELTSDMTLLCSDEDDNDVTPTGSPSPVFPEERPPHQASLNHVTAADPEMPGANCSSQGTTKRASTPWEESGPMVHYYWGVPFCPRGLDPDKYTQVILAQMEVYEKSLKLAQRCLLRKAEWGEPVLPRPENSPSPESPAESPQPHIPQRHCLRLRRNKQRRSVDASPAEEEDEKETDTENKEDQKNDGGEEDDTDCEVCPETQLSDVNNGSTQDLTVVPDDDAQTRPECPEPPEAEMIVRGRSPAAGQQQTEEEMEVDSPVPRETEGSVPVCRNVGNEHLEEERLDPDVEEVTHQKIQLQPSAGPQSPEAHIDCPICQGSFPATEIEVHAAYCDGEVAIVDERRAATTALPYTLKPCRKRIRRAEVMDEGADGCSAADRDERCYVCQKAVPLSDYHHHTVLCIQRQTLKSEAKGNLLSALEQSESRDSDAGPSKLYPGDVIDLRDDEDENEDVSAFSVSNSPIRSFTPISEATDCLIDFRKQQRSKKPSRRRR